MGFLHYLGFPDNSETIDRSGLYTAAYDTRSVVLIAVEEVVGVVVGNPNQTADPVYAQRPRFDFPPDDTCQSSAHSSIVRSLHGGRFRRVEDRSVMFFFLLSCSR